VLDVAALAQLVDRDVAALMVTNPNTLGVFEENIMQAAEILHAKGAMLYMDGANMNALVGIARPGDFGVDVLHLNLHKTSRRPTAAAARAQPRGREEVLRAVPSRAAPEALRQKVGLRLPPQTLIGPCAPSTATSACWCARWLTSWRTAAPACATPTVDAVLNAVYIRKQLEPYFDLPYASPNMHEVVFSDARQAALGVRTGDLAKRLIDYGFHPYTVSFPLIVHGALMIEPTETKAIRVDQFIAAMISIAKEVESDPQLVKNAPYGTRTSAWMKSPPRASQCCDGNGVTQKQLLLVLGLVLLIRIPFLNQAIQGDDHIYLTEASHALTDPLHPDDTSYVFQGVEVDLRGQPHPPLDAWVLAGLIAVFGSVKEIPFTSPTWCFL